MTATATLPVPSPSPAALSADILAFLRVPADYRETFVHYATVDRTDGEGAVRVMYVSPEALAATKAGGPLPDGTAIVMEQYAVARGLDGQLLRDADSRLVPSALKKLLVRVKGQPEDGQADESVPAGIRNGDWTYATGDPANDAIGTRDNPTCHACHQQAAAWDYLFSYPTLNLAAQTGAPQYDACDLAGRQPCQRPDHQPHEQSEPVSSPAP